MLAYQFANGHYLVAGVYQFVRIGNFHFRLFTDPQRCTGKESTTMYVGGYAGDISAAHIVLTATWGPSQYKDRLIYVWRFPC